MAKQTTNNTNRKQQAIDPVAEIAALGGKLPPQALDFEEAVLGSLLVERDAFQEVVEILLPEHFYKEEHKRIYSAMMKLNARNTPTDILLVKRELESTGELEQAGGSLYLVSLTEKMASAINIEYHARIVFQKYLQRQMIQLGMEMQRYGYDDTKDVDDLLQESEAKLFQLSQGSMKKDVVQIAPVMEDVIKQMHEAADRDDNLSGIPSGFVSIDRVTSGWQPATMIVIAARPAMGKTAFVLSMARKMAVDHHIPVAIFSLEMSKVELGKRLMTAETEIESNKIKSGRLTQTEWSHLYERVERLSSAPLYIDDTPGLSVFDLRSKARILHKKNGIKMIIIDYLQLMTASAMRPGNRQEEVSMISRSLKGLAKELNIPVVALSQLNRAVESRGATGNQDQADGKRPQLSDLRESGAIEQDADMVCFLHRPEYYKITEDKDGHSLLGIGYFIIAKHRSGGLEDIKLRFQGNLVRFEELDAIAMAEQNNTYSDAPMTEQTIMSKMNANDGDAGAVPDFSANDGGATPF